MFLADTGLFVTLAFWDKEFTENIIYQKLWADKLNTNLGYILRMWLHRCFELAVETLPELQPTSISTNCEINHIFLR